MGWAKDVLTEIEARLFTPTGFPVCSRHVLDDFIRSAAVRVPPDDECGVCGLPMLDAFDVDSMLDLTVATLRRYRGRAIDDLLHDAESESGYAGAHTFDTRDAVSELFEGAFDDELLSYVGDTVIDDRWYRPGSIWLEGTDLFLTSWQEFRRLLTNPPASQPTDATLTPPPTPQLDDVLHGRYDPIVTSGLQADGYPPSAVLAALTDTLRHAGLVVCLPGEQTWLRAVHLPDGEKLSASRIGSAPPSWAGDNRMSRQGVSMFYGAIDEPTARVEVGAPREGEAMAIGVWRASRPLRMLDLDAERTLPSLYDLDKADLRWQLEFLRVFAIDVSQPINADNRHEYLPTQLLSEHLLSSPDGIDGIIYRSAKTGMKCCVVNVGNEGCVDRPAAVDDGLLRMELVDSRVG